jgi:hypothetical protein
LHLGSNTEYSEKSEVNNELDKKIQKCGSATLYESRNTLQFEEAFPIRFYFFSHFLELEKQLTLLLRKNSLTRSKNGNGIINSGTTTTTTKNKEEEKNFVMIDNGSTTTSKLLLVSDVDNDNCIDGAVIICSFKYSLHHINNTYSSQCSKFRKIILQKYHHHHNSNNVRSLNKKDMIIL